jgi:hypothetical protein
MTKIEIEENRAEKELAILENELIDIEELLKNSNPFICMDIKERMSIID